MSIYKEVILDHYHHPHNRGSLEGADATSSVANSTCGDKIKMSLVISQDTIQDIKFEGKGCAISISSASLLTDHVKGMSVNDVKGLSADDITMLLGIELSPNRMKCALLPLSALREALAQLKEKL